MSKKKEIDLTEGLNSESIKASLEAGIILPRLIPILDEVYTVIVNSLLKTFESNFGTTYHIDVIYKNADMNIILPISFRFQLSVEMIRNGLVKDDNPEKPDFNKLLGKELVFGKRIGNTKEFKNVELYFCQINL